MVSRISQGADAAYARYAAYPLWRKRLTGWLLYTAIFLFGIALAYGILLVTGRSIIWTYDSSAEYYPAMIYFSETLKRFFSGLARGELIWPQYGFTIGFGEDIISSLNYYGFADPLYLITALIPRSGMEFAFVSLAFLRAYLSGIFFYRYIRWFGVRRGNALLGAASYALCGFAMFSLSVHQIFLNVMMYLPLILLGFEHLLKGKRPVLMPVATALLAFSGYYMLYMTSIFVVVYATFRFFREYPHGKGRAALFFRLFITAAGFYTLGVALAGATLLPSVWGYLHKATSQMFEGNLLIYSARKYATELSKLLFLNNENPRAVAIWAFAAAVLMVTRRRTRRRYAASAAAIFALLCLVIPFFGYMFNGFAYVTDRWTFILSFLCAAALSVMYQDLLKMKRREWLILSASVALLFIGFVYATYAQAGEFSMRSLPYMAYGGLAALATAFGMRLAQKASAHPMFPKGARRLLPLAICAVFVAGNLGLNGFVQNAIRIKNGNFLRIGEVDRLIASSPVAAVDAENYGESYRVEVPLGELRNRNDAMALNMRGTSCYFSVQNASTLDGITALESVSRTVLHQVLGLDQREALLSLMNVRYYAKREGSPQQAPYGFRFLKREGRIEVYENLNALPLGYSTPGIISNEDYKKMTGLERQQALLSGAVLHGDYESTPLPGSSIQSIEYSISGMEGMEWADGVVRTGKNPSMMLSFEAPGGTESYLRLTGLDIKGSISGAFPYILVTGDGFEKKVVINGKNIVHSHCCDVYLVNLGFHEEPLTAVTLSFPVNKTIELDAIEVLSVPMAGFEEAIALLRAQPMTDIMLGNDRIEGNVNFDAERTLVIGLPYSDGWTAEVDGVKTPIDPSNGISMALRLPAGAHHVVLTYENPWQKTGIAMSLTALAALIALWAVGLKFGAAKEKREVPA